MWFFLACDLSMPNASLQSTTLTTIRAGTYQVGPYPTKTSAKKQPRTVTVQYDFGIEQTEFTQRQYIVVMETLPQSTCNRSLSVQQRDLDSPVTCLSWCDAIVLANTRSIAEGLSTAYDIPRDFATDMLAIECNELAQFVRLNPRATGWRLPTEAEWDIVSRGWDQTKLPVEDSAWFLDNASHSLHVVGQKKPNAQGLYDVQGNVSEWIWEEYGDFLRTTAINPFRKEGHLLNHYARLIKGGNALSPKDALSLSLRPHASSALRSDIIGVRFVRTLTWYGP